MGLSLRPPQAFPCHVTLGLCLIYQILSFLIANVRIIEVLTSKDYDKDY
jgi:hypothetical protein